MATAILEREFLYQMEKDHSESFTNIEMCQNIVFYKQILRLSSSSTHVIDGPNLEKFQAEQCALSEFFMLDSSK